MKFFLLWRDICMHNSFSSIEIIIKHSSFCFVSSSNEDGKMKRETRAGRRGQCPCLEVSFSICLSLSVSESCQTLGIYDSTTSIASDWLIVSSLRSVRCLLLLFTYQGSASLKTTTTNLHVSDAFCAWSGLWIKREE